MPTQNSDFRAAAAGLWRNNLALVQLLGLCPLLAVTTTVVNGLALGLATLGVLVSTSMVVALLRGALIPSVRVPLSLLIIASLVTCVDLLAQAVFYDLHEALGLFIPLIVTNCGVLAHAEAIASRRPMAESLLSAMTTGLGFLFVLVLLGALREVLGRGTLLGDMPMLAGEWSAGLTITLPFDGMLIAILPPGAFFGVALLLALRNHVTRARPAIAATPETVADAAASR